MDNPVFILGTHQENPDWPTTPEKAICVLCDKEMHTSGYGTDPANLKTYKMNNKKNKLLAIECVVRLMGQTAHALQSAENMKEMLEKK